MRMSSLVSSKVVTYLVLAAPLIAVAAAFIPPLAEATWRGGHPLKAFLWSESRATTDSPLQAPTWLLPAALDVVAFMAIWTGHSGHRLRQPRRSVQVSRRAAKRKPPTFSK